MQEEIRVAYGKAVRAIRQNKKISQEELGDLCGLHRTYISCKLRSNGMPVPLLRNGYSIFNGTKYR